MDIEIDITATRLESQRLLLRPWQESDLNDFYEYASVAGVGEMAGWNHHTSIEESREILQLFIKSKFVFAMVDKKTNKVIGSISLHPSWANDDPEYKHLKLKEIGYVLAKDYWGRGFMPEAVKTVIKYAFEELALDALTVGHFSSNYQSRRVIEKCGFKLVKQDRYYAEQLDKYMDDMKYILFR